MTLNEDFALQKFKKWSAKWWRVGKSTGKSFLNLIEFLTLLYKTISRKHNIKSMCISENLEFLLI